MQRQHFKKALASTIAGLFAVGALHSTEGWGQSPDSIVTVPAGLRDQRIADSSPTQYLPFAHFNIPFDVDSNGGAPTEVHLWVSPDGGRSWMKYASSSPEKRAFEFHAAAEGEYLFAVQTRNSRGDSALAASPPMRVQIDTTKPQLELSADLTSSGRIAVQFQVTDAYLDDQTIRLEYSLDGRNVWEPLSVSNIRHDLDRSVGSVEFDMPRCRELEFRLSAKDKAQNQAETIVRYNTPRTAAAASGMQLASQRVDTRTLQPKETASLPSQTRPADARVQERQLADNSLLTVGAASGPVPMQQDVVAQSKAPTTRTASDVDASAHKHPHDSPRNHHRVRPQPNARHHKATRLSQSGLSAAMRLAWR